MNAAQILHELENTKYFNGVFPRDKIPKLKPPFSIIINTDAQSEAGEHWVSIFVTTSHVEYFDPIGFPPFHKDNYQFIDSYNTTFFFSSFTIQNVDASMCGRYCIEYVKAKSRSIELNSFLLFLNKFSRNLIKNDQIVSTK